MNAYDSSAPPAEGETPLTDAAIRKARMVNPHRGMPTREREFVTPDFARSLERANQGLARRVEELAQAAKPFAELFGSSDPHFKHGNLVRASIKIADIQALRSALASLKTAAAGGEEVEGE